METVIKVKNLGKKYDISHMKGGYISLREVLANVMRHPFAFLKHKIKKAAGLVKKEEFWALKDVNFEIQKGEVVGIIGSNGAGKSTLLKILSQITTPTEGEVEIKGRVGSLLEVGTGFNAELTGRENIFLNGAILGMSKNEIAQKFDQIVEFSGVEKFIDTPVKRYSSGMYVRLAFAVAAHMEPDILIIDEVLAVGDTEFQKKCLGKMDEISQKEGRTVLFVSHNLSVIESLCKRCILLEQGMVKEIGETKNIIDRYTKNMHNIPNPNTRSFPANLETGPKITKVSLLNQEDKIQNVFIPNQKIRLKLEIQPSKSNNKDYSIVWFISNAREQLLAVSSSVIFNKKFYESQGRFAICEINPQALIPGGYFFRIILHVPGEENFDDWKNCLHFEIVNHDINNSGYSYPYIWSAAKIFLENKWL